MYYLVGMPLYIFDDEKYIIHVYDLLYNICDAHVLTHSKKHFKSVTAIFFSKGERGGGEVLVSLSV